MKNHTITEIDFANFEFEHELACAHGKGQNKSLKIFVKDNKVSYRVYNKQILVSERNCLSYAVQDYNEIY